jgi:hypothetical protein
MTSTPIGEVLDYLGLPQNPTMVQILQRVDDISAPEARTIFNILYQDGSWKLFADKYELNIKNFAKFMAGEKNSGVCVQAIRRYSIEMYVRGSISTFSYESTDIHPVRQPSELIERVKHIFAHNRGSAAILFIDGDNCPYTLNHLFNCRSLERFLIIFYTVAARAPPTIVWEWRNRPLFLLCHSLGSGNQAVDIRIAMDTMAMHSVIANEIDFYLVSRDRFAEEVSKTYETAAFKRNCYCINPKQRNISVVMDIDFSDAWQEYIQSELEWPLLTESLACVGKYEDVLVEVLKRCPERANISANADYASSALRAIYRVYWIGNQQQFCEKYELNSGRFSAFLSGAINNNKVCEIGIRKFIEDIIN